MTDVSITTRLDGLGQIRQQINRMDREISGVSKTVQATTAVTAKLGKVLAGAFGIQQVARFTRAMLDAEKAYRRAELALEAVTGSVQGAQKEWAFLTKESDRLGLNLTTTAIAYGRLAASAKAADVSTKALHEGFSGLAEAFTVLSIPAEETGRILVQLDQALSLGKVQMQDLRAVANAMPGTFGLVERAFADTGKTVEEMLSSGGIPAEEFFKRFTKILHEEYGPKAKDAAQSLSAEFNRLDNATSNFLTSAAEHGFLDSFKDSLKDLSDLLEDRDIQRSIGALVGAIAKLTSVTAGATARIAEFIVNGVIWLAESAAKQTGLLTLNDQIEATKERILALAATRERLVNTFGAHSKAVQQVDKDIQSLNNRLIHLNRIMPGGVGSNILRLDQINVSGKKPQKSKPFIVPEPDFMPKGFFSNIDDMIAGSDKANAARVAAGKLEQEMEKQAERAAMLKSLGDEIGDSFVTAFERAATGANSFMEVLKDLAQDLHRAILRQLIFNALKKGISSGISSFFGGGTTPGGPGDFNQFVPLPAAKGHAFGPNGVIPFAKGGVVSEPSLFKFARGVGMMGEAGAEAIMPLSRGADGKLGVRSSGGVAVEVNVINNGQPLRAERTEQRRGPEGQHVIDVVVEDAMNRLINDGRLDPALATMGVQRPGRF